MQATTYTSDFEHGIMSSMKAEFPAGVAVGCLFHWKQAIKRKLVDFHIPKHLIRMLMGTDGVIFATGTRRNLGLQIPVCLESSGWSYMLLPRIRTIVIIYRLESHIHKLGGPYE